MLQLAVLAKDYFLVIIAACTFQFKIKYLYNYYIAQKSKFH